MNITSQVPARPYNAPARRRLTAFGGRRLAGGCPGHRTLVTGIDPGPQPSRADKRWYFGLMAACIGLFVLSWAVIDRYSSLAAIIVAAVAVAIPPFAVIVANVASATDRRRR
jgi:hypothetical protein